MPNCIITCGKHIKIELMKLTRLVHKEYVIASVKLVLYVNMH